MVTTICRSGHSSGRKGKLGSEAEAVLIAIAIAIARLCVENNSWESKAMVVCFISEL